MVFVTLELLCEVATTGATAALLIFHTLTHNFFTRTICRWGNRDTGCNFKSCLKYKVTITLENTLENMIENMLENTGK